MRTVEIYFNDLKEEKQKELLEIVGADDPKEMNWDMDFSPLVLFDIEEGIAKEP